MWFAGFTLLLLGIMSGSGVEVLAGPPPPAQPSGDIVDTGYAKYRGNRAYPNTVAYLGVPYAEPPLGERRFRAPLPLDIDRVRKETKGQVVDATQYPAPCIQGTTGGGDAGGAGSENCLKVNIYTPSGAGKHSKCYVFGNPASWPFEHWINQSPNVVIVSVYYRLSSLGFLALPELRDPVNGDLNAGFLDQIEALRWVKKHIASFGGDSSRVTIDGNSAGGASVELHMISSFKERLFSQAIAQSVYRTPLPTPEQLVPLFKFYATTAGCGEGTVQEQLACLRRAPVSALAIAQDSATRTTVPSGYFRFIPVVDGKTILDFPTRLITEGKMAAIPLIVGATTNETLGTGSTEVAESLKRFFPSLLDADIAALENAYPAEEYATADLRYQGVLGDVQLKCARSIMATALARKGVGAYTYRYNQRNPTNGGTGVWHASENWMMFKGSNTGVNGTATFTDFSPAEDKFSKELIAYWLSFVRTGNPNAHRQPGSPVWPTYTLGNRARIVLQQAPDGAQSGSSVEKETEREVERCKLVVSQVDRQQN
ncbi:EstA protein [Coprinopsis sp. MPI-PUGE-AT-0042]|nr:EstA protein [Coprinopsis sp. MPI-PUGE-AT-0042]